MSGVLVVIPARLGSTRLPRKPLLHETGKYLIQHVWERAQEIEGADEIVIATDSDEILAAVASFGGHAEMTAVTHESGTDRVAEVARTRDAALVINVQGDEPSLPAQDVSALIAAMAATPEAEMGTLTFAGLTEAQQNEPSIVKAVVQDGWAIDFRREATSGGAWHVGVYAYRPEFLQDFTRLQPTENERERRLEQMRALDHGHRILAVAASQPPHGIDTPQDYAAFVAAVRATQGGE